jgi:hypothetical protein
MPCNTHSAPAMMPPVMKTFQCLITALTNSKINRACSGLRVSGIGWIIKQQQRFLARQLASI